MYILCILLHMCNELLPCVLCIMLHVFIIYQERLHLKSCTLQTNILRAMLCDYLSFIRIPSIYLQITQKNKQITYKDYYCEKCVNVLTICGACYCIHI